MTLIKSDELDSVFGPLTTATMEVARKLRQKLDGAALDALRSGMDWCESLTCEPPDPFPKWTLFDGPVEVMVVKAGPMKPGGIPPVGYRVIRHSDWIAAGRPGDAA